MHLNYDKIEVYSFVISVSIVKGWRAVEGCRDRCRPYRGERYGRKRTLVHGIRRQKLSYLKMLPSGPVKAVVVVGHGMNDHKERFCH